MESPMKHNPNKKRGSILVMSIFFMVILFIMASAFLVLIPVESRAAQRSALQTQGALVADAGVTEAITWMRFQLSPADGSPSKEPMASGVYPSVAARTTNLGKGWTYRWELIPDSETFPNGSNSIRAYSVVSKAYQDGNLKRIARAEVIQDSLSQYAALYDEWPDNLVMPVQSTSEPANGPVHINDVMRLWIPEGNAFWSSTGSPKFSHGISASGVYGSGGDGFAYYQSNWSGSDGTKRPYDHNGPIASRYDRMAVGGRSEVTAGTAEVPLPKNNFEIRDAAWGFNATNPLPSTNGVYLNEENGKLGGIYIKGDVEEMQLGLGGTQPALPLVGNSFPAGTTVNYGDNSWVKIEQPGSATNSIDANKNVTVVTVKTPITVPVGARVNGTIQALPYQVPANTTLVRNANGSFTHYPSELNGVVYTDGDVNNLWGTNKGRRTLAVESDPANGVTNDIIIGGKENDSNGNISLAAGQKGLLQFGATDADADGILDAPTDAYNTLGLVAYNVRISSKLKQGNSWTNSHPQNNPLYLYGIVLGGNQGQGGSYKVDGYDSGGAGWVYRYGSRIMGEGGAWGTTSGHGLVNGNTYFDEPASLSPPPYFPSAPSFTVKAYEDSPALTPETL